ncbi:AcrB/AcrD/AcrF family protein [Sphingomonas sinipercae]|uniref:AcrB/AcrD/AcrF family protein n=1 Tax=Sphingomonas sinipercae TaxID=2714944 RepID=UPI001FE244ED|nr:AcrB/AcrD/AcrF family protein [Sphingomonas sinipercae]
MLKRKEHLSPDRLLALLDRHWKLVVVIAWVGLCAWYLNDRWGDLRAFALGDTDDNMRMMQVRALLHGQDWFDLRQYRLNPPYGANMHWSHLVDLPLAGLILLLRPLVGGPMAEMYAAGFAPLIPYLALLFGLALVARRLIHPAAYPLAIVALFFAGSTNGMFMPDRIDHHGWQLALLSIALAGLADPRRARGGITLGIASALSLAIGLELLIYLAIAGAATVLFWVADREERGRLAAYAVSLSGGVAFSFLVFASYANRAPVCDALSPVWLADALLAGALLFGLSMLGTADWKRRLMLALAAGAVLALFHTLTWPHCLQRLEGVSDEVNALWLSHVREARPVYRHGWKLAMLICALPVTGLVGWALLSWRNRIDRDLLRRTLAAAAPAVAATVLLLWQTRTGPAAQMMGTIGAASLVAILLPLTLRAPSAVLRTIGPALIIIIGAGAAVPLIVSYVPAKKQTKRENQIAAANRGCNFIGSFKPIAKQPRGIVFTFVDTAPRLIAVTRHSSIIGPYHRNGEQIGDVMKAFRGSPEQARAIMAKYRADYLLTCPNASTTTIFRSETPKGFYSQLERGQVPGWLTPIDLGKDSPFRMWRIAR